MDNERAKLILSAYRPDGSDTEDLLFQEALTQARLDPDLGAWMAEQAAFDKRVSEQLRAVRPPRELRASLLLAGKVTKAPIPVRTWRQPAWFALAATILVLAGMAFLWWPTTQEGLSLAGSKTELQRLTQVHGHAFDTKMADFAQADRWLADQGAPHDFVIPSGLTRAPGVGCDVIAMGKATVTVLCFPVGTDKVVHLYVFKRNELRDPPPEGRAAFEQDGAIAMAAWSDSKNSYVMASRGSVDSLRELL